MSPEDFFERGWCLFPRDETLHAWLRRAVPAAQAAISRPANAQWLRCGGTWFVGVNALFNVRDYGAEERSFDEPLG